MTQPETTQPGTPQPGSTQPGTEQVDREQVDPQAAEQLTGSASVLSDGETPEDLEPAPGADPDS